MNWVVLLPTRTRMAQQLALILQALLMLSGRPTAAPPLLQTSLVCSLELEVRMWCIISSIVVTVRTIMVNRRPASSPPPPTCQLPTRNRLSLVSYSVV